MPYVILEMIHLCKQLKYSLLAFTLWISFILMSATVQSAQPESPPEMNESALSNTLVRSGGLADDTASPAPSDREWTTTDTTRTLILQKGTTLVIKPNSRVLRLPMIPVALGGKEYAKSAFSVELVTGRIDVEVDPRAHPIYGVVVRAPRKVGAIVKAGRATISASPADVTIAARSGKDMMSAIGEQWRPLRIGKAFTVSDKYPSGAHRALLPAPTLQIDTPVAITVATSVTPQHLSWTSVSGSTGYQLNLYRNDGNTPELIRKLTLKNNRLLLENLEQGRYCATIASLDETLLESSPSAFVGFQIVEAVLPPGGQIFGNVIQLPETERLKLLHVENLELSYGNESNYFVAAPESVGLHDGSPVTVRLREKGTTKDTQLRLEPLDILQPTIELAPVRAVWPGPPVTVTVRFRHRDGHPAPAPASLVADITINNLPVVATWQKTQNEMSCLVEKPAVVGPWVVRVILHDALGRNLARDFLEVAEQPRNSPSDKN